MASISNSFIGLADDANNSTSLLSHASTFGVIDYSDLRYLNIDPSIQKLLGYYTETLAGIMDVDFIELWHRNDLKVFREKILPETFHFLKKYSVSDYPNFSFSFNYRVKAKDGKHYTLLQRSTYSSNTPEVSELAAVGSITDITNYKTDSSIIHTIEKIDLDNSNLTENRFLKSVYFPDKTETNLSKRELQILAAIYEGLGSKLIADRLSVSINTVNNHRRNMLQKTKTSNASDLIRYATSNGWL